MRKKDFNSMFGPEKSLTVPYSLNFDRFEMHNYYNGASLRALVKLARKKGYRLIGTNEYQYNAFFIKNNLGLKELPTVDVESCFTHPKVIQSINNNWPQVKKLDWVKV